MLTATSQNSYTSFQQSAQKRHAYHWRQWNNGCGIQCNPWNGMTSHSDYTATYWRAANSELSKWDEENNALGFGKQPVTQSRLIPMIRQKKDFNLAVNIGIRFFEKLKPVNLLKFILLAGLGRRQTL
jgi:hypothetical protein